MSAEHGFLSLVKKIDCSQNGRRLEVILALSLSVALPITAHWAFGESFKQRREQTRAEQGINYPGRDIYQPNNGRYTTILPPR